MPHIILLGDSILDNGAYTNGGPDVAAQLRALSPTDEVTLLARDGDTTREMPAQIARLPHDATHLMLSIGGNDALQNADFLLAPAQSVAEVLTRLSAFGQNFAAAHRAVVEQLKTTGLPLALCTIYDANFGDAQTADLVKTALAVWNDAIVRQAIAAGLPVIDLRAVCSKPADYANEIEPSSQGGAKIARAIRRVVDAHRFDHAQTTIYF